MANKGKRETNKQITEVKQEIQKELDKISKSSIKSQQTDEDNLPKKKKIKIQTGEKKDVDSIAKNLTPKINSSTKKKISNSNDVSIASVDDVPYKDTTMVKKPRKRKGINFENELTPEEELELKEIKKRIRRNKLNDIKETSEDVKERVKRNDNKAKKRFTKDQLFREQFKLGNIIEEQILEDVNNAKMYNPRNHVRQSWVEMKLRESKERYGEQNFYKRLVDEEERIKQLAHTIVWASEQEDTSSEEQAYYTLLFNLTDEEQQDMIENNMETDINNFVKVDIKDEDIPF